MCRHLVVPLILLAIGCSSPRSFVPAQYATALSVDGRAVAAEYELGTPERPLGNVRVWSDGVVRQDLEGETHTLAHVSFLLLNLGETPIELDAEKLALEEVLLESGASYRVPPLRVQGNTRVAPAYRQEIDVSFRLPGVTSPDEVQSYRVAWTIRNGGTHAVQTAFLAATEPTSPRPRHTVSYSYGVYWWVYPWPDDGYGWPYYYPVWPYYYGWVPYSVTYEQGGYWRYWTYPAPWPLPPSYLRSRHR